MKTIEWLCPIPNCSLEDLQRSNLASIRMRAAVGAETAKENGYRIAFSDGQIPSKANVIIVTKIDFVSDIERPTRWLQHLRTAREQGGRIVIDYTDHHLAVDSPAARFYKEALGLANTVVCSSQTLKDYLADYVSCERIIIEDPIEVSIKAPRDRESNSLTALWFGHASNLPYLIAYLQNDFKPGKQVRLVVMTNAYPLPQKLADQLNCPELEQVEINVVPWSLKDMEEVAAISDLCLLPAGLDDPRKNGASSNRLLTALALGLPVAADPLPSYQPFKPFFADLRSQEGRSLLKNPAKYLTRVKYAQAQIRSSFTKEAISADWLSTICAELKPIVKEKTADPSVCTPANTLPKLQVLIISYKQEHLCDRIITNIESYASENVEVLIQDDCSPDRTYEILAAHFDGHPNVKTYRNKTNLGVSRNSASLLSKATAEYALCVGADDFILVQGLREAIALLDAEPLDVGIFTCAHAKLPVIDRILGLNIEIPVDMSVTPRNIQFTQATKFSEAGFFEEIATKPGALWGQGTIFRTSLLKKIQPQKPSEVDEWEIFHNLAVHAKRRPVRTRAFDKPISILAFTKTSRGRDLEAQLTRQISAVANGWDPAYRKKALINILEKKLKQFWNSDLSADEVITVLKQTFSQV